MENLVSRYTHKILHKIYKNFVTDRYETLRKMTKNVKIYISGRNINQVIIIIFRHSINAKKYKYRHIFSKNIFFIYIL